jgi:succinoglycan biosynthesis protein ExoA
MMNRRYNQASHAVTFAEPCQEERSATAVRADPATILVAIPTLNEAAHIAATLSALMTDAPRMAGVQIVVADGGSTDATCSIVQQIAARHGNIRLIHNPERLQAAAVNRVVSDCATSRHQILVRVDAHAHYPSGYVLAVADSLLAHDVAALATAMDSVGSSCFQRGAAWAMATRLGSGGSGHRGGTRSGYVDHGHHAGFRLDVWRQVGGYNTDFRANEDAELDHRITLAGGKIWLDAEIRLGYVMRPTLRKLALQYWRYGQGRGQTLTTHRLMPRLRQMIPPISVAVNLVALAMSPWWPGLLWLPGLYLALLSGTALHLAIRHASLCGLCAAPALLVMHQAWGAGFLTYLALNSRPADRRAS